MEPWQKAQLDSEDQGQIALQIFQMIEEVEEIAEKRAEKAREIAELEERLEKVRSLFNQYSWEEGNARRDVNEWKKYLKERQGK